MKRVTTLTALLVVSALAFAQPPQELVRECSAHLRAAQDAYRATDNAYADDTLLLIDALQAGNEACFGGEVQYAQQKPLDTMAFGDGLITTHADGYTAYMWHRQEARLYVADESGLTEVAAPKPLAATFPEPHVTETVEYFEPTFTPEAPVAQAITVNERPAEEQPRTADASELVIPELVEQHGEWETLITPVMPAEAAASEPQGAAPTAAEAVRQADELLEAGDIQTAQTLYLRLIQEDYRNSFAHDGLARARFLAGNLEEAATTLQVAASIEPDNFRFHFNLGIVLHLLERHQDAVDAFTTAVTIGTDDDEMLAEAFTGLGLSQLHAGHAQAAVNTLKSAIAADPSADREYLGLTVRYRAGEGASLLPDVLDAAQRSGDYRFDLLAGRIYRDLRDFTSSDTHLARAEERTAGDTDLAQVLMQRAAMLIDAGAKPKILLGQVRDLDPQLWQASYNLGVFALQERQYPVAIELLSEAFQHSRGATSVTIALARAHLNAGDYQAALTYAQRALEASGGDHAAFTAALAAYHQGNYEGADLFLQGVDFASQPVDARALAGAVKYQLRDFSGALAHFEAAYRQSPTMDLRRNLVNAMLATSRFQDAAVHLREMTRNNPNEGMLHQQLGWAEHMLGNTIDAQLAFRRATALGAPLDLGQ